MIKRYQVKAIKAIWSDTNKYETWLTIEKLVLKFWASQKLILPNELADLLTNLKFDCAEIVALEEKLRHDVFSFITNIINNVKSSAKKWIHFGLTSSDVVDTANGVMIQQTNQLIEDKLTKLMETIKFLAFKYKMTPQIGRTHGIHAEITSLGLKFAQFYLEFQRHLNRFALSRKEIEVGKISGAVGTYANTSLELEAFVCHHLNLAPAIGSTQVVARDNHAFYFNVLNLIGLSLNKLAIELRHLARSEVDEVNEFFDQHQVGSSAMPHKKNPIGLENVSGLSRLLQGYSLSASENVALWHERDISHSSNERVLFLDATTILVFMLDRMNQILENLVVNQQKMIANIELSANSIYSQTVMLYLIKKQLHFDRLEIYQILKSVSNKVKTNNSSLEIEILNSSLANYLTKKEIEMLFNPQYHLRYVSAIFASIFSYKN